MKKKDYTIETILFCLLLAVFGSMVGCSKPQVVNDIPKFYNGQILLPDYAHTDTLIVTDAETLNYLIARDSLLTDGSISDILCITTDIIGKAPEKPHECKWPLCPYKGITTLQWHDKVKDYVGNDESEAFSIDMLHLYKPQAEYEELETMLLED
jgi:hypothetical protein